MGMVRRAMNKAANQRVAATRVLEVGCTPADLPDAVQGLFDAWNSAADAAFEASLATQGRFMHWVNSGSVPSRRHYFLLSQPDWLMATYGVRAIRVAERGFNPQDRGWAARISLAKNTDDEATRIAVALAKWSIDSNGLIWNGQRYVQMLDGLVAGLDGRYISGPVDEEDHRFIKRA